MGTRAHMNRCGWIAACGPCFKWPPGAPGVLARQLRIGAIGVSPPYEQMVDWCVDHVSSGPLVPQLKQTNVLSLDLLACIIWNVAKSMNAATAAQSNNNNMSDEWGHDSVQSAKVGTPLGTRCRAINNAGFRGRPAGLRRQAPGSGAPPGHGLPRPTGPGRPRPAGGPGRPRPAGGCETLAGHGLPGRRGHARPRPARVLRGPAGLAQAVAYWARAGLLAGPVPWLKQVQERRRLRP
eukprot:scaffold2632_cov124-Isochrysis_galbana.AAC.2